MSVYIEAEPFSIRVFTEILSLNKVASTRASFEMLTPEIELTRKRLLVYVVQHSTIGQWLRTKREATTPSTTPGIDDPPSVREPS